MSFPKSRSFDSAEVRFAQDDSFRCGMDFKGQICCGTDLKDTSPEQQGKILEYSEKGASAVSKPKPQ